MNYPFSMRGRKIEIHRFRVEWTERKADTAGGQAEKCPLSRLFRDREKAIAFQEEKQGTFTEVPAKGAVLYRVDYEEEAAAGFQEAFAEVKKERCFCGREEAEAFAAHRDGSITELDSSGYEWMDGIEVADVPDTCAEAVKIWKMGREMWLTQARDKKQAENNLTLAEYLSSHPILWTDGKPYGVTQQDQQEIALNLTQYQLSTEAGLPAKLEWHPVHEECREFTQEELTGLAVAISEYVYPLVRKNQMYKAKIYGASAAPELEAVSFDYEEEAV